MVEQRVGLETALRAAVAERLGPDRFGLWFGEGVRLGLEGDSLTVGVPNGFSRDWIRGHFSDLLLEAAEQVLGSKPGLVFEVGLPIPSEPLPQPAFPTNEPIGFQQPDRSFPEQSSDSLDPSHPAWASDRQTVPIRPTERPRFEVRPQPVGTGRPTRRLDDFVVGPGNRLAHAAAVEMSLTLGSSFNPLFLHGGIGLGKTHLLEGLAASIRARAPGRKLVHVTAEAFTNLFLEALRTGGLPAFRSRFRSADVLIMDDVHFLAAKRATVDEFLHTFNSLSSAGAAIILSADQHPRQIPKLTDELATRFLGGMVVRLEAPDPATRKAILIAKAAARGVDVPEPVTTFLADHLRGSVRELEGALHSVLAHATLTGRKLDLALARSALRDTIRFTVQAVALRDIERTICKIFNIEPEALRSESRSRSVTHPRMLAMFVARRHAGASYAEIGRYFGGRNHSTVISAEHKVRSWLDDEHKQGLLAGFETVGDALAAVERELGV